MTDSPLRLLMTFDDRAQRDRGQSPAFLHRRDRKFALTCEARGQRPDTARWLRHLDRLSGPGATAPAGACMLALWQRVNTAFMAVGAVTGVLTMLGLLFYEGGQRINITVWLAFVVLQLLLATATSLQSVIGWQPWRWLLTRLQRRPASAVAEAMQPVLMARAAHLGGLCFGLTGLVTLLVLVVVKDLAFGWSTTLETAASSYHQILVAIAAPWAWLWPQAVPDLALVEATRFFRAGPSGDGSNPALWGQWWPFVAMLWLVWVIGVRALLLVLASLQTRRRARRLLTAHPAMQALLYRLETPTVSTGNDHNDAGDLPRTAASTELRPMPDTDILLCWAGAGEPALPESLSAGKRLLLRAGGRNTLEEDRAVLAQVRQHLGTTAQTLVIATRGWEPPTGELQDFLDAAKASWPTGTQVVLVPLATDSNQAPGSSLLQPWLRFAERVGHDFARVSLALSRPDSRYASMGATP